MTKLAAELKCTPPYLKRTSQLNLWSERVLAFDQHLAAARMSAASKVAAKSGYDYEKAREEQFEKERSIGAVLVEQAQKMVTDAQAALTIYGEMEPDGKTPKKEGLRFRRELYGNLERAMALLDRGMRLSRSGRCMEPLEKTAPIVINNQANAVAQAHASAPAVTEVIVTTREQVKAELEREGNPQLAESGGAVEPAPGG